LTSKFFKY